MRRDWCTSLLLLLALGSALPARAQTNLDEFLKPDGPSTKPSTAPKEPEAAPALKAGAGSAGSERPAPSPAVSRRARQEARTERKQQVDAVTDEVRSSTVKPSDAKSIESSSAEKGAVRKSSVDTVANDPAATSKVVPDKPAARGKKAAVAKPERRPKKKSAYDVARESWHAPAPPELCEQFKASEVPNMVLRIQGKDLTFVLRPNSRQGGWTDEQLAIAKEAFGSWEKGPTPNPRTLDLVYAATLNFGCPYVTLISGIRKDRGGSRHSHGLPPVIVLPGVDDEDLAAYFRAQGFVGVGTYPRSGFVHVDTRDQSFFWVDRSKPNQHGRVVQVRKDESTAADEAARERGTAGFVNPPKLQKALKVRLARKRRVAAAKQERAAARAVQGAPTTSAAK